MKCKNTECNKTFEPKKINRFKNKMFCSRECGLQYRSKKRYNQLKNNKDFKEKRKKYFNKWYQNNKEEFNKRMKQYQKKKNDILPHHK